MGLSVSWEVVLFFALGMLLLYGVGWLLLVPLKKGLWFLFNSLVGGLLLWIAQLAGGGFGAGAVDSEPALKRKRTKGESAWKRWRPGS